MAKLHKTYEIIRNKLGPVNCTVFFDKSMSQQFYYTDQLNQEIEDLKLAHLEEVLSLKEKISHLIDQNYKLHQSIRSNT